VLEFNTSHCDQMDLNSAWHTTDVVSSDHVHLHLDAAHRGLGPRAAGALDKPRRHG